MESHPLMDFKSQKGAEVQPGPVVQGAGLRPFHLGENVGIFDVNFRHPPTLRDVILEDKARTEVDPDEVHRIP
jgi:hypothetical protein